MRKVCCCRLVIGIPLCVIILPPLQPVIFGFVATASYRLLPEINLLESITGELAHKLQACFNEGVIGIRKNSSGRMSYSRYKQQPFIQIYNIKLFNNAQRTNGSPIGWLSLVADLMSHLLLSLIPVKTCPFGIRCPLVYKEIRKYSVMNVCSWDDNSYYQLVFTNGRYVHLD